MIIDIHPHYRKVFKQRIAANPNLVKKTSLRLKLFIQNPKNPLLHDHQLKGIYKHLRAFSVTGDIRIIYRPISDDNIILLDIGSHNQVY